MAESLRRVIWIWCHYHLGIARVGSNPAVSVFFCLSPNLICSTQKRRLDLEWCSRIRSFGQPASPITKGQLNGNSSGSYSLRCADVLVRSASLAVLSASWILRWTCLFCHLLLQTPPGPRNHSCCYNHQLHSRRCLSFRIWLRKLGDQCSLRVSYTRRKSSSTWALSSKLRSWTSETMFLSTMIKTVLGRRLSLIQYRS